jgi:hypothetical protein
MNEQELATKIVQHLDQGLDKIRQGSLYQLQSARMAALERYREAPQTAAAFAWAGDIAFRVSQSRHFNLRNMIAAGLLVLGMLGVSHWQIALQGNDIAEIDASLLTGELPINAYLDNDFETWLKRSSQ